LGGVSRPPPPPPLHPLFRPLGGKNACTCDCPISLYNPTTKHDRNRDKIRPKMAKYRILIVDDQREVRKVLSSGIETLGSDFSVLTVPSGEEAVLEISMQKFDLLVTDVRLPGISGLEVMRRVRASQPELKVILITGVLDPVIRRNVADAGADAFFLKPIEVSDFLDAVERCLGLVENSSMPESNLLQPVDVQEEGIAALLANLHKELDAFAVVLLDERGRVMAQAGDLPDDEAAVDTLFPALMAGFSAGMKVSHFLGANRPDNITYYGGTRFALLFAPVTASHALLVAVNAIQMDAEISDTVRDVYNALNDLQLILENMGVPVRSEESLMGPDEAELLEEAEEEVEEDLEHAPILDALFEKASSSASQDVDAFWDALADGASEGEVSNADVLTYEQALQLGLAPDGDDEEE
jgi:CheY-like chemotaxis protein